MLTAAEGGAPRRGGASEQPLTKGDRREQAILDALESLLVEAPLAQVSVGRIAERAGVGRTAFYFYFASREAALTALAQRTVAPIYERARPFFQGRGNASDEVRAAIRGVVDLWFEQSHLFYALIDATAHEARMLELWREQVEGLVAAAVERYGRESSQVRPGLDVPETVRALAWMTERYLYVHGPGRPWARDRDALADTLTAIWLETMFRDA